MASTHVAPFPYLALSPDASEVVRIEPGLPASKAARIARFQADL